MTELAFLIFALVGLVTTAKLWKPWVQQRADELELNIKDSSIDLQDTMHAISDKIVATKEKHGGEWYTLEKLDNMMK